MPGFSLEHETSPAQTRPDTLVSGDTERASQTEASLDSSQIEAQTVERLVAQTHRQQKRYFLLLFSLVGIILALSPLLMLSTGHIDALAMLLLFNAILMGGGLSAFLILRKWTANASSLEKLDDRRTVGAFVEMLASPAPRSYRTASKALISLLPRLQAGDAGLLDSRQRGLLRRFVGGFPIQRNPENIAMAIAILKAYEQIGDRADLPIVERLAQGQGWAADPKVREAAIACLPTLRQRVDLERDPQTLLRASADTDAAGETLLRPAQEAASADAGQLLRAAPNGPASEIVEDPDLFSER